MNLFQKVIFNFQFNLQNFSYKPKKEITEFFTKELEIIINEQLEINKINEKKKYSNLNLNISSSSFFYK